MASTHGNNNLTKALQSIADCSPAEKQLLIDALTIQQPAVQQPTLTKKELAKIKFEQDVINCKKGLYIFFKQSFKNRVNNKPANKQTAIC